MGKVDRVTKDAVKREPGFLYYLGKDGFVWKNPMRFNKTGKKAKAGSENVKREAGFLYFVDAKGFVARTKMARKAKK